MGKTSNLTSTSLPKQVAEHPKIYVSKHTFDMLMLERRVERNEQTTFKLESYAWFTVGAAIGAAIAAPGRRARAKG